MGLVGNELMWLASQWLLASDISTGTTRVVLDTSYEPEVFALTDRSFFMVRGNYLAGRYDLDGVTSFKVARLDQVTATLAANHPEFNSFTSIDYAFNPQYLANP